MKKGAWLEIILDLGRKVIPRSIFRACQPAYHYLLAMVGAVIYRFPSREIYVLAVTGTKGKTTTIELANAILEQAGQRTAMASTLRIKIGDDSQANEFKMTIKGRFFLQRFLRQAVKAGCQSALIELTSEGAKQYRHRFIELDALIFTNLAPEHIESHGSYEKYLEAKLEIMKQLSRSTKQNKMIVVNGDDRVAHHFLAAKVPKRLVYKLADAKPYTVSEHGITLRFRRENISSALPSLFNLYNILAAATVTAELGIPLPTIRQAIEGVKLVRGRMERIEAREINPKLADFAVIVDYAHTPDSLREVYQTFTGRPIIAVFGGTGGGRDNWKRPVMGTIASELCRLIILTDEDPYNEDPEAIVKTIIRGIKKTPYKIIMDRREAIRAALKEAKAGEVVIITGKGTDPYIMGPRGTKTPWDDATVVREELKAIS